MVAYRRATALCRPDESAAVGAPTTARQPAANGRSLRMAETQKINPDADCLIVGVPDTTTSEEIAAFRAYYDRTKGRVLPGFEFLLEHRPDVLKRYRAGVRVTTSPQWRGYPLQMVLQHLHQYIISGYG